MAIYARVSTYDQQTLPMQLEAMQGYVANRGWRIVQAIEDIGSGASDRPKRAALLNAARRREIDVVVVWRLDRWGRSLADTVVSLRELCDLGVGFVSLTEALDLTTPTGRAMAGLLAVFAEFEREVLRERVKAGLAQARRKGKRLGRPASITSQVERVQQMHAAGASQTTIARTVGISRPSVQRILKAAQPQTTAGL
ncbi:MAG: recombinase family protein [Bdellovibrionales bacterium]|nr:recombinase family protein [Bdellovibrionales bacterium]